MLNFENLDKFNPLSNNKYQIPDIESMQADEELEKLKKIEWISFNYVKSTKKEERKGKGVHFFIDDYQFIRVWNNPDTYIDMLADFDYVLTPDFSTYTDMPKALQIYNCYRKQWLGAYWQSLGLNVIPTVSWSTASNMDWIFDGMPRQGIVAISTLGCMNKKGATELFHEGWRKARQVLEPSLVLCYGRIPPRFEGKVIQMGNFSDRMAERIKAKNGR